MGEEADATWLIILLAGAVICGLLVLFLKSDYRFDEIVQSNENYYPAVKATPPGQEKSEASRRESSRGN